MAEFRDTNDFIDRKRVYADLSRLLITDACGGSMISNDEDGWTSAISKAMDVIMEAPAADVRPEILGRWITKYGGKPFCSYCGYNEGGAMQTSWKYCPNCGAKMDGNCKSDKWIATSEQLPLENQIVDTKIDDEKGVRNEQELIYSHNLWFLPDKSMYVYYTPTHWRYKANMDGKR